MARSRPRADNGLPAAAPGELHWYAVHTRSRHEKQVARQLSEKQFEAFLPLRPEVHRWKDRYKRVELPLFSGYLFVRLLGGAPEGAGLRLAVLKTPGVMRIVGFGRADTPVPDEQIEILRRLAESQTMLHRHRYLRAGQRVKILSGALAGVEGILVRVKKADRLVIAVQAIRQAVALELSGYEVVALG